jgi:hypothetical protein
LRLRNKVEAPISEHWICHGDSFGVIAVTGSLENVIDFCRETHHRVKNPSDESQARRHHSPIHPPTTAGSGDESGVAQDRGVMRNRGLTLVEWPFQIATAHFTASGNDRQQAEADGVAERSKDESQILSSRFF